jgi:hypothetical protein
MICLAYVDPGSGLLVWQLIAASVVGCLFYVKKVRQLLYRWLTKPFRKAPAEVAVAKRPGVSADP